MVYMIDNASALFQVVTEPLPEPILTQIYDAIWRQLATMS